MSLKAPWRASFWRRSTCGLKNASWAVAIAVAVLVVAIVPAVVLRSGTLSVATTIQWKDIVTKTGDRLPDFSFCGYRASEQPLPSNTTRPAISLNAQAGSSEDDDTTRIQKVLDSTAKSGGGVVALGDGDFILKSSGLRIPSGVVLRGAGVGRTRLTLRDLGQDALISFGSKNATPSVLPFAAANIIDQIVPIGSVEVTVADAKGFKPGQHVFVKRLVTAEWVDANGMGDLVLDGERQTWIKVGTVVRQPRVIRSIQGNTITLNIPLTDSLNAKYMQPFIVAYDPPDTSSEMGIEYLSIVLSPTCSGARVDSSSESEGACDAPAISFDPWSADSWARNLELIGFNTFVTLQANTSRITIQNVAMIRDADAAAAGNADSRALPGDIILQGATQVLIADCSQRGLPSARSFAVMTQSLTPGPNAILRHVTSSNDEQMVFPHQRWAHGLLVEDTATAVHLVNRATNGSGHGWAVNAGVGWNLRGYSIVQSPPLGINWCVGCSGTVDDRSNGTFVDSGGQGRGPGQRTMVQPNSLFDAQLRARLNTP
ncbi:hypothetical protein B0H66DRAFT_641917 [Apodospora peruviana]|uniref:Pectate lyase superfamily protein domain-containing protein n=1 Tax=Apodospora peruviana TaxID=516989 RepID=A0AAE0M0L8_9PEZI|nr:hypothetical protein B0H66DRAFT_641917 [Apodospora peruviana]